MKEAEKLITEIGELVATGIDEVEEVSYPSDRDTELTAFTIMMTSGKKYKFEIAVCQ